MIEVHNLEGGLGEVSGRGGRGLRAGPLRGRGGVLEGQGGPGGRRGRGPAGEGWLDILLRLRREIGKLRLALGRLPGLLLSLRLS